MQIIDREDRKVEDLSTFSESLQGARNQLEVSDGARRSFPRKQGWRHILEDGPWSHTATTAVANDSSIYAALVELAERPRPKTIKSLMNVRAPRQSSSARGSSLRAFDEEA